MRQMFQGKYVANTKLLFLHFVVPYHGCTTVLFAHKFRRMSWYVIEGVISMQVLAMVTFSQHCSILFFSSRKLLNFYSHNTLQCIVRESY